MHFNTKYIYYGCVLHSEPKFWHENIYTVMWRVETYKVVEVSKIKVSIRKINIYKTVLFHVNIMFTIPLCSNSTVAILIICLQLWKNTIKNSLLQIFNLFKQISFFKKNFLTVNSIILCIKLRTFKNTEWVRKSSYLTFQ